MKVFLCFIIVGLVVGWIVDHQALVDSARLAREDAYWDGKGVDQVADAVAAGKTIAFAHNDSTLAEALEEVRNGGLVFLAGGT